MVINIESDWSVRSFELGILTNLIDLKTDLSKNQDLNG